MTDHAPRTAQRRWWWAFALSGLFALALTGYASWRVTLLSEEPWMIIVSWIAGLAGPVVIGLLVARRRAPEGTPVAIRRLRAAGGSELSGSSR